MKITCRLSGVVCLWLVAASLQAASLPPKPTQYFNDYAGMVSAQTRTKLEKELADLDRATSTQILVALFPALPPGAALEDHTRNTAEAWGVGRKQTNNGVILFAFQKDRALRIEVGYGLEGALPDAIAKRIIEDEIVPRFKKGDFDGGISEGVHAILKAVRGEYAPVAGPGNGPAYVKVIFPLFFFFTFVVLGLIALIALTRRSVRRRRRGWVIDHVGSTPWNDWTGGRGGGASGGGNWDVFGSSGGGGFSGGGGSFGGGGASGHW